MYEWIEVSTILTIIMVCGVGMAHYEHFLLDCPPSNTLIYHWNQLWWMVGAFISVYSFRHIHYDTIFRFFGELAASIGAGVIGYIIGRAFYF